MAVVASPASPDGDMWFLTEGYWGAAPLNTADITVHPKEAVFGKCKRAIQRNSKFETVRYNMRRVDTYDAFLFGLGATLEGTSCSGHMQYMVMEIPTDIRNRCHARISLYRSSSDLPTDEQRLNPSKFLKGNAAFSAGYGLRSGPRDCHQTSIDMHRPDLGGVNHNIALQPTR